MTTWYKRLADKDIKIRKDLNNRFREPIGPQPPTWPTEQTEEQARQKALAAGQTHYWWQPEKAWKLVNQPEAPLSRMPFQKQITQAGQLQPFKKIGEVSKAFQEEVAAPRSQLAGLSIGEVAGLAGIAMEGGQSLINAYKAVTDTAILRNIQAWNKTYGGAKFTPQQERQAVELVKKAADKSTKLKLYWRGIFKPIEATNQTQVDTTALTKFNEEVSNIVRTEAPKFVPMGTASGITRGGMAAEPYKGKGIQWNEMPSVTTGGKQSFFVADTPQGKRWVVWNKAQKTWQVTGEQTPPSGLSPIYGNFKTAEEGKKFVEESFGGKAAEPYKGNVPEIGKQTISRTKRAKGTDIRIEIPVGQDLVIRAHNTPEQFKTSSSPKAIDEVWSVYRKEPWTPTGERPETLLTSRLTKSEALKYAQSGELTQPTPTQPEIPKAAEPYKGKPEITQKSLGEASASDVIADIKAKGFTKQTGYGQFVKARGLKPEIDMKEFSRIYDSVMPKIFQPVTVKWDITPTHIITETYEGAYPKRVQILEEGEGYTKWITEEGSIQSSPNKYIKSIEEITPTQPEIPKAEAGMPKVPPPPEITAKPTTPEIPPEAPESKISPVIKETSGITPKIAKLADQLKAKLEAEPPVKQPTAFERREEIQKLLEQPAKSLPKGTTKIALRQELAKINKEVVPQEKYLRQEIMKSARSKGLTEKQYREIFKTTGGSRYLSDIKLPKLDDVLVKIRESRPTKIGNRKVLTISTERAIQSLKSNLIQQGKFNEEAYNDTMKYLNLKTDKFVDKKNFISETQARELIRRMNYQAEIGLIERDNKVAEALKGKPEIKTAIDKAKSRITKTNEKYINGKPVNVSATYSMRYYMGFLQDRSGGRFYDVWTMGNDKRLANRALATKLYEDFVENAIPDYAKIVPNKASRVKIREYIASKNKYLDIEAPELTEQEMVAANALEKLFAYFPNIVREHRFKLAYDHWRGNPKLMKEGINPEDPYIPDAPLEDLREAVKIYESQGNDALRDYLDTKTWGVKESGYEPRDAVVFKLRLNKLKSYVVGKGHLKVRHGIELPNAKDDNIFKDARIYINQILNLTLEPYMKELDRIFVENADKFKDSSKVGRNLELAILEMQGKTVDRTPLTEALMKIAGYAYTAIFLRPSLPFRNLFQNLAFAPIREKFLDPRNKILNDDEMEFFNTYVKQDRAFRQDILLQDEMGTNRLARFMKQVTYYHYSDDLNRLGLDYAQVNETKRALEGYHKGDSVDKFTRTSGIHDLTDFQQVQMLELLAIDEGIIPKEVARQIVVNTHFPYDRAERSPLEMGASGRVLGSLLAFTRGWAERLYLQLNAATRPGGKVSGASRARAWKNVIGIIAMGFVAGEIYKKITGKKYNPYDPRNILSWTPGGLPVGVTADIAVAAWHLSLALAGDRDAQSRLTTELPALGDAFIPFYDSIISMAESLTDTQYIDRKALRDIRAEFDKDYKPNESYYEKERGIIQQIQHALFGSEPEVKEETQGLQRPELKRPELKPQLERPKLERPELVPIK